MIARPLPARLCGMRPATGLCVALTLLACAAPALEPPRDFAVFDVPGDDGSRVILQWAPLPQPDPALEFVVESADDPRGPFTELQRLPTKGNPRREAAHLVGSFAALRNGDYHLTTARAVYVDDEQRVPTFQYYRVGLTDGETTAFTDVLQGMPRANWFRWTKLNNLLLTLFVTGFVLYGVSASRRNPNLYVRRIAGLEAIDEAVGRATEMGKPLLYLTGYHDANRVSTLASINILSHVARTVANYDSRLIVPSKWSVAMAICQETVRDAYVNAGRPDAFREHDIYYVAGEQFSYTAAVDGIMVRERPAANFLLGTFAAEALILAETGASTGAIQIAGTDSSFQIPFFVVCCDYCLIGEELYAASAYLSNDPRLRGTLRGQDLGKVLIGTGLVLGSIGATLAVWGWSNIFWWVSAFFTAA